MGSGSSFRKQQLVVEPKCDVAGVGVDVRDVALLMFIDGEGDGDVSDEFCRAAGLEGDVGADESTLCLRGVDDIELRPAASSRLIRDLRFKLDALESPALCLGCSRLCSLRRDEDDGGGRI